MSIGINNPLSLPAYSPNGQSSFIDTAASALNRIADGFSAPIVNEPVASYKPAISSTGSIQSAMNIFSLQINKLSNSVTGMVATSSAPDVAQAVAKPTATAGNIAVNVTQLAQPQTLTSAVQKSDTAIISNVGPSTLSFQFGTTTGSTFTGNGTTASVNITAGSSLNGIAASVNAADIGVKATVADTGAGFQLSFTGKTGADQSMTVSATDTAIQSIIGYNPTSAVNGMTQTVAAQNSSLTANNIAVSSATNKIQNIQTGVDLSLSGTGATNINVGQDLNGMRSAMGSFVDSYNSIKAIIDGIQPPTPLSLSISKSLNAVASSMSGMGVSIQKNGTMALNKQAFDKAAMLPGFASSLSNTGKTGAFDQFSNISNAFQNIAPSAAQGLNAWLTQTGQVKFSLPQNTTPQTSNLNVAISSYKTISNMT